MSDAGLDEIEQPDQKLVESLRERVQYLEDVTFELELERDHWRREFKLLNRSEPASILRGKLALLLDAVCDYLAIKNDPLRTKPVDAENSHEGRTVLQTLVAELLEMNSLPTNADIPNGSHEVLSEPSVDIWSLHPIPSIPVGLKYIAAPSITKPNIGVYKPSGRGREWLYVSSIYPDDERYPDLMNKLIAKATDSEDTTADKVNVPEMHKSEMSIEDRIDQILDKLLATTRSVKQDSSYKDREFELDRVFRDLGDLIDVAMDAREEIQDLREGATEQKLTTATIRALRYLETLPPENERDEVLEVLREATKGAPAREQNR